MTAPGPGGSATAHVDEAWMEGPSGVRVLRRRWQTPDPGGQLLLVHGLGDHSERYREVVGVLAGAGLSVTALDLPGHGRSGGRRGDAPSVESLLALLDGALGEMRSGGPKLPTFVLGHSMGGLLAIRHLQTRPEGGFRAAVLSAPWLATARSVPSWKRTMARMLLRLAPGLPIGTGPIDPRELTRDPERQDRYRSDPLVHQKISPRLYHSVLEAQEVARAGGLNLPALFLVPGEDPLVDPGVTRAWAVGLDSADVWELPEDRHEPWNELGRAGLLERLSGWLLDKL